MTQGLNLQQQLQQLSQQSAQDFYAQSVGSLKSQIQNYREQLEQYSEQLPDGDAKAQVQEMVDYYYELEGSIDQAAQEQGIQDQVEEAAQSTQEKMTEFAQGAAQQAQDVAGQAAGQADRKSTRLNSSHANISYAVFCLKKKIPKVHTVHLLCLN